MVLSHKTFKAILSLNSTFLLPDKSKDVSSDDDDFGMDDEEEEEDNDDDDDDEIPLDMEDLEAATKKARQDEELKTEQVQVGKKKGLEIWTGLGNYEVARINSPYFVSFVLTVAFAAMYA